MNPNLPITLYASAYAGLFVTWLALVLAQTPDAGPIIAYIQGALAVLSGHVLTMINPAKKDAP